MVLGLGGCCGGVGAVADGIRKVSPAEAENQQRVVKDAASGCPPGEKEKTKKERKKRDHEKSPPIMTYQFPFHSRPSLL